MTDAARSRQPGTARDLLAALVERHDVYVEAQNGNGHPGTPHNDDLQEPGYPRSTVNDCSACGGAQYGSESDFNDAIEQARAFLAQPDGPQDIDVERLRDAANYVVDVWADEGVPMPGPLHFDDAVERLRIASSRLDRAQQPEGGAEGEGRA